MKKVYFLLMILLLAVSVAIAQPTRRGGSSPIERSGGVGQINADGSTTIDYDVRIDGNLYPNVDNVYDLGSVFLRWHDTYLSGTLSVDGTVYSQQKPYILVDEFLYVTGNVGIGSTVPRAKLDVDGGVYVSGTVVANQFAASGGTDERIYGSTGYVDFNDLGSSNVLFGSVVAGTGKFVVGMAGTIDTTIYNPSGKLILGSAGNVGLGTVSPSALLDVGGFTKSNVLAADSAGVKGSLEVDGKIYADGAIYWNSSAGYIGNVKVSGVCRALYVSTANTVYGVTQTCP